MEGGRRSLLYHLCKEQYWKNFCLSQDRAGRGLELSVETSLAHGGCQGLGQGHHEAEHFSCLLGHHRHLGSVVAACQAFDDGSHDRLGGR